MKTLARLRARIDRSYPMRWTTRLFARLVRTGKTEDTAIHEAKAQSRIYFGWLGWN